MPSSNVRPYYLLVRKEEEKGDKYAKINMEVKHMGIEDPLNPFIKKTVFTQTYPTQIVAAAPRRACCFYCC